MVFLSKFLPALFYPLGLAFLLLAGFALRSELSRRQRAFLGGVALLLWLGGNTWLSLALARTLEWRYLPQTEPAAAPVIVLLGGDTAPASPPQPIVQPGQRAFYAAALYHQGKAGRILVSGGAIPWQSGGESATPADQMYDVLRLLDVPPEAITLERQSRNTAENARYSAEILAEWGVQRIILVTSALHMPRARALFEAQGLTVIPAPTGFAVTRASWNAAFHGGWQNFLINLIPTAGSLNLTTTVLKEYLGMAAYRLIP
ncbi:MAG: YdcF family protein [Anaerolineae bacterium]|nr:MAG: YdcF family protein [Anaerolineae bacterium]